MSPSVSVSASASASVCASVSVSVSVGVSVSASPMTPQTPALFLALQRLYLAVCFFFFKWSTEGSRKRQWDSCKMETRYLFFLPSVNPSFIYYFIRSSSSVRQCVNGLVRPWGQNMFMNARIASPQDLRTPNLASRRLWSKFQDTRAQIKVRFYEKPCNQQ